MPVVDRIDVVLDALPKQGPYNGVAFNSLFTLGLLLSDPDKIKRHGSGLLQMESISVSDAVAAVETDEEDFDSEMIDSPSAVTTVDEEATVADTSAVDAEDDHLPGFDDFLSNYNPVHDVFERKKKKCNAHEAKPPQGLHRQPPIGPAVPLAPSAH